MLFFSPKAFFSGLSIFSSASGEKLTRPFPLGGQGIKTPLAGGTLLSWLWAPQCDWHTPPLTPLGPFKESPYRPVVNFCSVLSPSLPQAATAVYSAGGRLPLRGGKKRLNFSPRRSGEAEWRRQNQALRPRSRSPVTQLSLDALQHCTVNTSQLNGYILIYTKRQQTERKSQDLNDATPPPAGPNSETDALDPIWGLQPVKGWQCTQEVDTIKWSVVDKVFLICFDWV